MKIPPAKGQIFVNFHSNSGKPEVIIDGDPEGLKFLAKVCMAPADVDQKKYKNFSRFEREHLHLDPGIYLGENSARLILGRAEDKFGELNPDYQPRKLRKRR